MKGICFIGALAALTTSCTVRERSDTREVVFQTLDCAPRAVAPIGRLEKDIVGSWDQFGIDSRVVFTFLPDGGITTVEEPNQYATHGGMGRTQYRVLDAGIAIGSSEYSASINESSLTLVETGFTRVHPALFCRGNGFD